MSHFIFLIFFFFKTSLSSIFRFKEATVDFRDYVTARRKQYPKFWEYDLDLEGLNIGVGEIDTENLVRKINF